MRFRFLSKTRQSIAPSGVAAFPNSALDQSRHGHSVLSEFPRQKRQSFLTRRWALLELGPADSHSSCIGARRRGPLRSTPGRSRFDLRKVLILEASISSFLFYLRS